LSTSRTELGRSIQLGGWRVQVSGGEVRLLRRGTAFWEPLTRGGVETTIVRMPANFPPAGSATRELSGMGTPDLLGTYGVFTFFTSAASEAAEREVSGGRIIAGGPVDGVFRGELRGPENPLRNDRRALSTNFMLFADPDRPQAKLVVGDEVRLLRAGEWSDWVPVEFALAPGRRLNGMVRFYLKELRPTFQLYATPINLDPLRPAMPISEPGSWSADLARATGRYYTQGMPEDTKAYTAGVFDPGEFVAQAAIADGEARSQYAFLLRQFERGLFFYYFGGVDQTSHMMWRPLDAGHPAYVAARDAPFAGVVPAAYRDMDGVVGETFAHMDSTALLVVMSDHGFTSWRRAFHLNAWLREQGYLVLRNAALESSRSGLVDVDWSRTRAYGLGLNGLYVNLRGRERDGIVAAEECAALLGAIATGLRQCVDPLSGAPAVTRVDVARETYTGGGALDVGPDIVVGYAKGTRCSDESALGAVPLEVFTDNTGPWSGDHCMDPAAVPGILLTSRPLRREVRSLRDLGAAIVAEFEVQGAGGASRRD
jgi:hypothetical protein